MNARLKLDEMKIIIRTFLVLFFTLSTLAFKFVLPDLAQATTLCTTVPLFGSSSTVITLQVDTDQPIVIWSGGAQVITTDNPPKLMTTRLFKANESATTHYLELGAFPEGLYIVNVEVNTYYGNDLAHIWPVNSSDILTCSYPLKISNAEGQYSVTIDPPNPITQKITTINSLTITGLTPGYSYKFPLSGAFGTDHWLSYTLNNDESSRTQIFTADANKKISLQNMCSNGEGNRTGDNACGDVFLDGTYSIQITDPNTGHLYGTIGFTVNTFTTKLLTGGAGNSGTSSKNPCNESGCETAVGTIPINLGDFASAILRIALGLSGGIVLILMVIGSVRVMTSSGDPQKMGAGRDMIVAAVAGALFIAFSVMIMTFLGVAIVPLPGLVYFTG